MRGRLIGIFNTYYSGPVEAYKVNLISDIMNGGKKYIQ